jgi:hypothetical protein
MTAQAELASVIQEGTPAIKLLSDWEGARTRRHFTAPLASPELYESHSSPFARRHHRACSGCHPVISNQGPPTPPWSRPPRLPHGSTSSLEAPRNFGPVMTIQACESNFGACRQCQWRPSQSSRFGTGAPPVMRPANWVKQLGVGSNKAFNVVT